MRHILMILIIVIPSLAQADPWYEGTVDFLSGTSRTGLIENSLGSQYVLFKTSMEAKEEKLESSTISGVRLKIKDKVVEYHFRRVYLGWGQKKMSDPTWIEVVEKGIVTLYVIGSTMSSRDGLNKAGFLDYYCIRAGEPGAKMIANVSTLNNNQTFRAKAPLYFEDYPELANKIKSKEYTWKDLTVVVQEYNKWAEQKNK